MKRTDYCGHLKAADAGREVVLTGWVQRRRDHGGLIFVDLRDREGLVQVVFNPEDGTEMFELAESVRNEYVLLVKGKVRPRPEGTVNPNLPTGEVEVLALSLEILNRSKTPPFYIEDEVNVDELMRLKYRYLDLRRPEMQEALRLRHKTTIAMRKYLDDEGFYEIETPILCKSSPEGARDYLVPSRVHPGEFFALPQSPQLFKQILMVAGMDKYFQIARCFRDEDLRADRQPEFTQLDMEMSFVEEQDVRDLTERMLAYVVEQALGTKIETPFPVLTYRDAMERFGSDKPDLRFGMELVNIADIAEQSDFKVFAAVAQKGGCVRVAKHGNRAASSRCGAADVLEALGVDITVPPEHSKRLLEEINLCFLFAQNYHIAMKYVAPVRRELGVRTVFNILGPLVNPAGANMELLGVYDEDLVEPMAQVLKNLGVKRALVVHGQDGLDEISLSAPTSVCELRNGAFQSQVWQPEQFGLTRCRKEELVGGSPAENAAITRAILGGEQGPKRDAVLLNSAAALYIAHEDLSMEQALALAARTIDSGKALAQLETFVQRTHEVPQ